MNHRQAALTERHRKNAHFDQLRPASQDFEVQRSGGITEPPKKEKKSKTPWAEDKGKH